MSRLSHLRLNSQTQQDPTVVLHFNYGYGNNDSDPNPDPDYTLMAQSFERDLTRLAHDVDRRRTERNPRLQVPAHIEYVEVLFQAQFSLNSFFQQWRNSFGLEAIQVDEFGTKVLFAVVDEDLMAGFTRDINHFIECVTYINAHVTYSPLLLYVKSFKLLTTEGILQLAGSAPLVNLQLTDLPLAGRTRDQILNALQNYLVQNNLPYSLSLESANLEISGASEDQLLEIVRNYDVALQVTSSLSTRISPGRFAQPERTYGFEVTVPAANLPIVAIVDTGISATTPLAPLIITDNDLNLTSTPVNQDDSDRGRGHGTAVAALAALGKRPYNQNYQGDILADALLLPIKILDSDSGYLSQQAVIEKMKLAKAKYPSLKIFVLATVFSQYKLYNERYSTYAYALDKFAYEHDCLVFISTGNNNNAGLDNNEYNLAYFRQQKTNLCPPSESLNNITVGAASKSLRPGAHTGIATAEEFPVLYTRKGHIDFERLASKVKTNKKLFKPDIIECGGDYSINAHGLLNDVSDAAMDVLSADPSESFFTHIGTSFSTPLAANIALQIQRQYPDLKAASIKALIINSASNKKILIDEKQKNNLVGFGLVNEEAAVFSSEDRVTMLLEETIDANQVKLFPLYFPPYLINDNLGKTNGLLYLTATLCFQFEPVLQHQQGYCPLHIAFGVFRNHTGDQIQTTEEQLMSKLKKTGNLWSQNGRDVSKPVPYTNVQKIRIPINKRELLDENSTFKLAVQCRVHPQLLPGQEHRYTQRNPFSIALTFEENLPEHRLTGQLYDALLNVNDVTVIGTLFGEAEAAEAEAER